MPLLGSFAAGSTKGFGGTSFVCGPRDITYDFMVIGGGGGGGSGDIGGGGGAGGVHYSYNNSPVSAITKNTDCGSISIQIGSGGTIGSPGTSGSTSIAFKCTPQAVSVGGGGGGNGRARSGAAAPNPGGGSGGGGGCNHNGGPTSGGAGSCYGNPGAGTSGPIGNPPARFRAGGGGGRCCAGQVGGVGGIGSGGNGHVSNIDGTCRNYGCGGGGFGNSNNGGCNGRGDGGADSPTARLGAPFIPTANQGGGGGGNGNACVSTGADGAVYLRFPTSCKPGKIAVTPGCNSILTDGASTVLKFIVSGCVTFD